MKHRYLEVIAYASLACYATIVVAIQSLHWGCSCHTAHTSTDLQYESGKVAISATEGLDASNIDIVSLFSHERERASASSLDCPVCHWFSMAQQAVPHSPPAIGVLVCYSCKLSPNFVRHVLLSGTLARGPPLQSTAASHV